jgi:hypothetical protein
MSSRFLQPSLPKARLYIAFDAPKQPRPDVLTGVHRNGGHAAAAFNTEM